MSLLSFFSGDLQYNMYNLPIDFNIIKNKRARNYEEQHDLKIGGIYKQQDFHTKTL